MRNDQVIQKLYGQQNVVIPTGTDTDVYSDAIYLPPFTSMLQLRTLRIVESGTCTLSAFVQGLFDGGVGGVGTATAGTGNGWFDLPNAAINDYADGELGIRTLVYGPMVGTVPDTEAAGDLRGVGLDVDTRHRIAFGILPEVIRFRFRNGGTSVGQTFSWEGLILPI